MWSGFNNAAVTQLDYYPHPQPSISGADISMTQDPGGGPKFEKKCLGLFAQGTFLPSLEEFLRNRYVRIKKILTKP